MIHIAGEGKKLYLSGNKGKGKYVLVDEEDFETLNQHKWHLLATGYAARNRTQKDDEGKSRCIRMHREIFPVQEGKFVDHINGNKLDNRKNNLREVTNQQNQWNKAPDKNAKSPYRGVYLNRHSYIVEISVDGKRMHVGSFSNEVAAANAYNYYASIYFKEYARLNTVPFMSEEEWRKYKYVKKSKYKGIVLCKKTGKWQSFVSKKPYHYLGVYLTEEEAVIARDRKIIELGLNIPLQLLKRAESSDRT